MKRHSFFKSLLAILLIVVGIILVLVNIGVISLEISDAFLYAYPAFFVLYGLKWIIDNLRGVGGSWTGGSFLVIFGSLLLLGRFDIINFTFSDIWDLWPLLLIYLGVQPFVSSRVKKKRLEVVFDSKEAHEDKFDKVNKKKFAIGDHNFSEPNWTVEPLDLWNAIGDYHFDFTKAFIPEKDTPISIRGWIGDVNILVPDNLPFKISAYIKTGDINVAGQTADGLNRELVYKTPDYDEATRKLTLYVDFKIGSIRLDEV